MAEISDEGHIIHAKINKKTAFFISNINIQVFSVGDAPVQLYLFHPALFPGPLVLFDVVSVLGEHPDKRGS